MSSFTIGESMTPAPSSKNLLYMDHLESSFNRRMNEFDYMVQEGFSDMGSESMENRQAHIDRYVKCYFKEHFPSKIDTYCKLPGMTDTEAMSFLAKRVLVHLPKYLGYFPSEVSFRVWMDHEVSPRIRNLIALLDEDPPKPIEEYNTWVDKVLEAGRDFENAWKRLIPEQGEELNEMRQVWQTYFKDLKSSVPQKKRLPVSSTPLLEKKDVSLLPKDRSVTIDSKNNGFMFNSSSFKIIVTAIAIPVIAYLGNECWAYLHNLPNIKAS